MWNFKERQRIKQKDEKTTETSLAGHLLRRTKAPQTAGKSVSEVEEVMGPRRPRQPVTWEI